MESSTFGCSTAGVVSSPRGHVRGRVLQRHHQLCRQGCGPVFVVKSVSGRFCIGKAGAYYYWISRGVDDREVRANRVRKSVGAENTLPNDLTDFEAMAAELQPRIDKVWRHCEEKGSRGRAVTLFYRIRWRACAATSFNLVSKTSVPNAAPIFAVPPKLNPKLNLKLPKRPSVISSRSVQLLIRTSRRKVGLL